MNDYVLVVDDNEHCAWMVREICQTHLQLPSVTMNHGREALTYLRSHAAPVLVIVDLDMPVMDGFDFYKQLQQHPEWRQIPVLVFTARTLTSEEHAQLGYSSVLEKGTLNAEVISAKIHQLREAATPGSGIPN